MFNVKFDITVEIKDCPSCDGIDCLDFRRKNLLPDGTDNAINLKVSFVDETVCREFKELLNHNCDLNIHSDYYATSFGIISVHGRFKPVIEVSIIERFIVNPQQNPLPIMHCILSEIKRINSKNEEEKRLKEEDYKQREATRKRQKEEQVAECEAWVKEHGSELLKERIAGGFKYNDLFRDEFAEKIFNKIGFGDEIEGNEDYNVDEIAIRDNPTLKEIAYLKASKSRAGELAKVELVRVKYINDETGESIWRTELKVTVKCPNGYEVDKYFEVK